MPSYAYKAVHSNGRVTRGTMIAVNENELAHYLSVSGMELIHAREKNQRPFSVSFNRSLPPRMLAAFFTRMQDLLASGLPFLDALNEVARSTDHKKLRDALMHIAQTIANGGGIAASFALYPSYFSGIVIALIGAGENSGDMGAVFGYLAGYANLRAHARERLQRALRYPLFLFFVAGGAVSFMLMSVVPQVVLFLNGIQGQLPLSTRILVALSNLFADQGGWIIGFMLFLALGIFVARQLSLAFAIKTDALILRLPFMGAVIGKTSLARFAHSFAMLFRSGCDAPSCLRQARDTIGNRALQADINMAEQRVQSGSSLSQAFDGALPAFAVGLLRTGERSGNLGKALDDIATAYDREAQAATDSFIGVLEPALTLGIGALLAWTVLAVLGPLYGSLSVLGGKM